MRNLNPRERCKSTNRVRSWLSMTRLLVPLDVVETHAENIAGSQTKPREEKQDCLVANAVQLREVARGDQPFDIGGGEIARQCRQSPLRNSRHRPIEPWATHAVRC